MRFSLADGQLYSFQSRSHRAGFARVTAMGQRWDYRTVEGALYGLGLPVEARPSQSSIAMPSRRSAPIHSGPSREVVARADFDLSLQRALAPDEVADVRDHYILGVRRHGYKRRASIIKKLVDRLNEGADT